MSLSKTRGHSALLWALVAGSLPGCQSRACPTPAWHVVYPTRAAEPPAASVTRPALKSGEIRRTQLESRPATGLPGWETRLYLIEYGPGAVAPLHIHPVVGVGVVLEGAFESAFGDEATVRVHAGQSFVDPAGVPHRAFRNLSRDQPLRFIVAYSIRVGEQTFYPGSELPQPRAETH